MNGAITGKYLLVADRQHWTLMTNEQRKHSRTPIKLTVVVTFPDGHQLDVQTWDISDGGIGIHFPKDQREIWSLNVKVIAQVKGLPIEGPKLPMRVVRIMPDRIGLAMA